MKIIHLLPLALLLLTACKEECLEGNQQPGTRTEESLAPFSRIHYEGPANIALNRAAKHSVLMIGEKNLIDMHEVESGSGELFIHLDQCFKPTEQLSMVLATDQLESVDYEGSGRISGVEGFAADQLYIRLKGAAELDIRHYTGQRTQLEQEGSGKLILRGEGKQASLRHTGNGLVDLKAYPVDRLEITLEGAGDCYVNVLQELIVVLKGSGNVYYQGEPKVSADIQGLGKIIRGK